MSSLPNDERRMQNAEGKGKRTRVNRRMLFCIRHSSFCIGAATFLLVLVVAFLVTACAPALAPAPVVTSPKFPDFIFPAAPASLAGSELSLRQQRGWQFLQAGDSRAARREFGAALKANGAFYPAEAGMAYASLADKTAELTKTFDGRPIWFHIDTPVSKSELLYAIETTFTLNNLAIIQTGDQRIRLEQIADLGKGTGK